MSRIANSRRKIFRGRASPAVRARNPYLLLPFEVTSGIKVVEIRYDYDDEGNILDLGVFDPRGCEFLTAQGFRGWSGSARREIFIGETWATPGYIPGPIYPGTWHVILGFYKVSPRGCSYEVTVRLHHDPIEAPMRHPPAVRRPNPYPAESVEVPGWLRGDLHCHTHHSEAQGSVEDLVHAAKRKGLDFLAITDHNTTSHWREMEELERDAGIVLIPGEEITTYWGHANVWGRGRWLDFRCRTPEQMKMVYEVAASEGRVFSINHPKPGGPPWEFGFELPFDCIEIWHGLWSMGNDYSLETWRRLLAAGRRVVAVGGSDTHPRFRGDGTLTEWLGYPTTWVFATGSSSEEVIEGIRKGHVSISACPSGPFLSLELHCEEGVFRQGAQAPPVRDGKLVVEVQRGMGLELVVITDKGEHFRERVSAEQWRKETVVDMEMAGFVRAELRVPASRILAAIANPIWREGFPSSKINGSRGRR